MLNPESLQEIHQLQIQYFVKKPFQLGDFEFLIQKASIKTQIDEDDFIPPVL